MFCKYKIISSPFMPFVSIILIKIIVWLQRKIPFCTFVNSKSSYHLHIWAHYGS